MSKISYCSLEEAWGTESLDRFNKENQTSKIAMRDNYELLNKKSIEDRNNVITNMNLVERNDSDNYDKYRINNENNVKPGSLNINKQQYGYIESDKKEYIPFKENNDKKYLEDKLLYLENELKKYKILIDNHTQNKIGSENTIVYFSNTSGGESENHSNKNNKSNDMIDLILLIIIGLLIIFVLNSVFTIGKSIGMRKKIE